MERLQLSASEDAVMAVAWQAREALQWFLWSFTGQNLAAWGARGVAGVARCWYSKPPKKDGEIWRNHDFETNLL